MTSKQGNQNYPKGILKLLNLKTTGIYTHVSKNAIERIKSPLGELKLNDE